VVGDAQYLDAGRGRACHELCRCAPTV
jgi:hypothetical protein